VCFIPLTEIRHLRERDSNGAVLAHILNERSALADGDAVLGMSLVLTDAGPLISWVFEVGYDQVLWELEPVGKRADYPVKWIENPSQ